MARPLEHDIVRPWACCDDCRNRYELELEPLLDDPPQASNHDDRIDLLLEILAG